MEVSYPVKLACIMVGLPARGKTYIARKIVRYFNWLGYPAKWFNVGNYRRDAVGANQHHSFFDPTNEENNAKRTELAILALNDMLGWFDSEKRKLEVETPSFSESFTSPNHIKAGGSSFVAV